MFEDFPKNELEFDRRFQQEQACLEVMRHAIALNASHFNTQRMAQEYIAKAYF